MTSIPSFVLTSSPGITESGNSSAIFNAVAAWDARPSSGSRSRDSQELNLTIDYKIKQGWLESFWVRVRGSWLHEQRTQQNGTDLRVIFRYDFPVI